MNSENIGTSLDSLADSFIDALTSGTKDYGDVLEDVIKTSLLNGFKSQLIEKSLQPFYNAFAEFSKDGLTQAEIEKLRAMKDQIIVDGEKQLKALEIATGADERILQSNSNPYATEFFIKHNLISCR
jgi:hypothetical protein